MKYEGEISLRSNRNRFETGRGGGGRGATMIGEGETPERGKGGGLKIGQP
jgi:hypothetical protein